jgi:hypothetical protein
VSRDPKTFDRNRLPPWLREVPLPQLPASAGPTSPAAADDDIPDWLRATAGAAGEVAPKAQPSAPTPPAASAGDDIPDWLRPPTPQQGTVESSDWFAGYDRTPGLSDNPSWSGDPAAGGAPGATPSDPQEMPDWLRDIVAGSGPAEAAPPTQRTPPPAPPASAPQPEAEVPDWLRELSPPEPGPPPAPPATSAPPAPAQIPTRSDEPAMPDWLRELSPPDDLAGGATSEPAGFGWSENPPPEPEATDPQPEQAASSSAMPPAVQPFTLDDAPRVQPPVPPPDDAPAVQPFTLDETPSTAPAPSGDLPPWLRQSDPNAEVQTEDLPPWLHGAAAEASSSVDAPSWLAAAPAAAEPAAPADVPDAATPDWLRDLPADDAPSTPPAPPSAASSAPAEELPGWLREEPPVAAPSSGASEELPGWLREEPPVAAPPSGAGETLPPWMQGITASAEDDTAAQMRPASSAEPESLPDWLRELPEGEQPPAPEAREHQDEAPEAEPSPFAQPGSGSLPSWLADVEPGVAPAQPSLPSWLSGAPHSPPPAPPALPPTAPVARAPEELDEARPSAAGNAPTPETLPPWLHAREEQSAAAAPAGGGELIGAIDLPAWLRAETSEAAQEDVAESRSLDWLARLRQQEEDSESTAAPVVATVRPATIRRPVAPEALALIQQLGAQPFPQSAPTPIETVPRWQQAAPLERALTALLLLGVLCAALLPGISASFASPAPPAAGGNVAQLHGIIDGLDDTSVVVVAYEWDAQRAGELAPLERSITEHLIARRAGIVTLSTDPQGALLSFNLRDRLREEGYGSGAVDDLFLGFLPGGELALRGLAQNFGGYVRRDFAGEDTSDSPFVTGQLKGRPPLTAIDQVALIIVVADEAQDVQGWVEQVRSQVPGVPMALVTPSEIGPFARPYLTRGELLVGEDTRGPLVALVGAQDALAYNNLRGGDDAAAAQLRALVGTRNLGLMLFVALLAVGGAVALARRKV